MKTFKDLLNIFSSTDDILIVEYDVDGRDHDNTLKGVMQICQWTYLKLNKFNVISGIPQ